MAELTPGYIIQSVQIPDFTVEDMSTDIQRLVGGIQKQFTSQASSYSVVFKWDFGDSTPIVNTAQRTVTHEYSNPGIYTVKHQACLLDSPCCYNNNIPWCVKAITVTPTPTPTPTPMPTPTICTWIVANGGIHPLPVANISTLIAAYLGYANVGFSMSGHSSYISGAIGYYLYPTIPSIGNNLTGCSFA